MTAPVRRLSSRAAFVLAVAALIALICGANAHLIYVALASQPDCVAHRRIGERQAGVAFAAAESSCSPSVLAEN
ncbi:hypothetical protein [Rhizobium oryzicola]|uniref:Uncharacterized protein n=1 Tax=Rhizobium oryzicola TaxID=1232668 RepID=A0ABT8SYP1_9HYPH|nr:hypothetical protein [Rhizobium oryzicola]MDO1583385.1 hypothetical protein [Rhizobium oryzicola]